MLNLKEPLYILSPVFFKIQNDLTFCIKKPGGGLIMVFQNSRGAKAPPIFNEGPDVPTKNDGQS